MYSSHCFSVRPVTLVRPMTPVKPAKMQGRLQRRLHWRLQRGLQGRLARMSKDVQRRLWQSIHILHFCFSSSMINLLFLISIPVSFAEPMPTFPHILRPLKLKLSQISGIIIIHISIILIIILNNHNISSLTKLPSNFKNISFCPTGQLTRKSLKRAGVVNILFGFKTLAKTNDIQYIFRLLILQ